MAENYRVPRTIRERIATFFGRPPVDTLTSAGIHVDLSDERQVKQVISKRQDWQNQAINTIYTVGELLYGIDTLASLVSRVTFFAATAAEDADDVPKRVTGTSPADKMAVATLAQLGNPVTITDKQYDIAFNLFGPGEVYLIKIAPRKELNIPDARWETRSIREIETASIKSECGQMLNTLKITDQITGQPLILDPAKGDTFLRIYRPDPFDHSKAISHVRAVLSPAEELLWWDAAAQATARSRLRMAGAVGIPQNLEAKPRESDPESMTGAELFIYQWMEQMIKGTNDPTDQAAAIPYMFSYPPNDKGASGIDVIEFTHPNDEMLETRTQRSLQRIEGGINLPTGAISDPGGQTGWGGSVIDHQTFRDHVEPGVLVVCSALTTSLLYPTLRKAGVSNPQDYFVWYDASQLVVHRDADQNAVRALELGAIGWKALRRELGYRETDAATPAEREEIAAWLANVRRGTGQQGIVENPSDPNDLDKGTDPNKPPAPNAPGDRTSENRRTAPTSRRGQDPIAASYAVQALCDEKVRQALVTAGNRLISRSKKKPALSSSIKGVRQTMVASILGPEAVSQLDGHNLFDDAFDDLPDRIVAFVGRDRIPTHAFETLKDRLKAIATANLYSQANGEILVPLELVQEALA